MKHRHDRRKRLAGGDAPWARLYRALGWRELELYLPGLPQCIPGGL